MPLTRFRIVPGTTTKALFFNGDKIQVDKIDDALAEQLLGKTHVLECLPEGPLTLEAPAAAAEQVATGRGRRNSE